MLTKTKVVVTINHKDIKKDKLQKIMQKGVNVARFMVFDDDFKSVKNAINMVNELNQELGFNVAVMLDLNGPEIRCGAFKDSFINVNKGDSIVITTDNILGDNNKFSVNYDNLASIVKYGSIIGVNHGSLLFEVVKKDDNGVTVEAICDGKINSYDSFTIKNTVLDMEFINSHDRQILDLANQMNVDFIGLSHVRTAEDVLLINDLLIVLQNDHIKLISKIENEEAVSNMDDIIHVSDGIMVARGDLGLAMPVERIPGIQKRIISKCHQAGIISIVATELLTSMEYNTRPTRSEVSDVANAVLDGTDAVLLGDETRIGNYPVEVVDMLRKIISSAEQDIIYDAEMLKLDLSKLDFTNVIAHSVVDASRLLDCSAIIAPTMSGYTASVLSCYRPNCPIIAISPNIETIKSLQLHFAVIPILIDELNTFDKILKVSKDITSKIIQTNRGDKIIVTGSYPFKDTKETNFMKIEEI